MSEPHKAVNPQTPTATPAEFNFRILLHVDSGGVVRLLKEAVLMKQPNPPVAGALVLLSNPALIPQFKPPANRDGAPFAYRMSSIGYDFSSGPDLTLTGTFGGTLAGTINVLRTDPITFAALNGGDLFPEAGHSRRTGTYQETVTGLHKAALVTTGTFTLQRMNTLGQINPPPAP